MSRRVYTLGLAFGVAFGGVPGRPAWAATAPLVGLPFKPGDAPPLLGPLRMGESIKDILATLGLPDSGGPIVDARSGSALINYGVEGYYLIVTRDAGLRTIVATQPTSGDIGGVTIGTSVDRVLKTWGKPKLQNDRTWIYPTDLFVVELRIDPKLDHVSAIMLVDLRDNSPQNGTPGHAPDQPVAMFRLTDPQPPHRHFPFMREEDLDGARFVWFVFGKSKHIYTYIPARNFPNDPQFRGLDASEQAGSGDVAWWPNFVGIFNKEDKTVMTGLGRVPLKTLEKQRGPAHFFRHQTDSK